MRTSDREITITKDLIVGHEIEIMVQSVGKDGKLQAAEDSPKISIEIQGKTTGPGSGDLLTVTAGITQLYLSWQDPEDTDFDVMEVWRHTSDFREFGEKIAEVRADYYVDELGSSGLTRYYWIRARNTSGVTSDFYPVSGVSGTTTGIAATEISDFAVTATKRFDNIVVLVGDVWTNDTPNPGANTHITWNEHNLVFGGKYYNIPTGNTNLRYVTWQGGTAGGSGTVADPYISSYTATGAYTYGATVYMIATNEAGVAQLVWNASANMVIGSAFILDAAITTAKIDNLAVTGAKITNATITDGHIIDCSADKLTAGTIDATVVTIQNLTVGTNVGLGTAEDAAGVTTIVGNTVTTGYVDALAITVLGAVTAGSSTGLTVQTASSGQRVVISASQNRIQIFDTSDNDIVIIDDNITGTIPGIRVGNTTDGGLFWCYKNSTSQSYIKHDGIRVSIPATSDDVIDIYNGVIKKFSVAGDGDIYCTDINVTGVYKMDGVAIIDASKNLTNIGTVGCGEITSTDDFNGVNAMLTGGLSVDGTEVVSAQKTAVANATGSADGWLRLNELLARVRAHGLIDT